MKCAFCGSGSKISLFGLLLLAIGVFYFAKELGWIEIAFPFWPSALIALGLYFLLRKV